MSLIIKRIEKFSLRDQSARKKFLDVKPNLAYILRQLLARCKNITSRLRINPNNSIREGLFMIRNNLKEYISRSQRDKIKPIAMIVGSLAIIGMLAGYIYWSARSNTGKDNISAKVDTTNPVKTNNPEIKADSRESKAEVKTSDSNTQTHAQDIKGLEEEIARLRKQNEELSLKVKNLEKQLRDTVTAANRTTPNKPETTEDKKPETTKSSEEKKLAKSVDKPRGKENKISYTVKKGDTLWSIADKYGVSVNAIKEWNNLRDEKLAIGEEITVIKP